MVINLETGYPFQTATAPPGSVDAEPGRARRFRVRFLISTRVLDPSLEGPRVRLGLYALLGLQYYWGAQILKKVARSIDRCPSSSKLIR